MSKIGYVRISSDSQCTSRQYAIMEKYGVGKENIYEETASGKDTTRPQLKAMLDYVRKGDVLVVESYSRLARSTRDLLSIVDKLQAKGVKFISDKESIDTATPQGKLMLTIFAGLSEFERECLLQRQAEGIVEAKKRGVYTGRKRVDVDAVKFVNVYNEWKSDKITARAAQKALGLQPRTFYRRVAEHEGRVASIKSPIRSNYNG